MIRNRVVDFRRFINEGIYENRSSPSPSDMEAEARKKVNKALFWINTNKGFFGRLLSSLNIYGSSSLQGKTMATNGLNIVYHPEFVLNQSDGAIRFVLCHEILHCVGEHMVRRGNREPRLWNMAADYAINPILDLEVSSARGKEFLWPVYPDKPSERMGLLDEQYAGMTAEEIYDILLKDPNYKKRAEDFAKSQDFGDVVDSDKDLPKPDSEESIVQDNTEGGLDTDNDDIWDELDGPTSGSDESPGDDPAPSEDDVYQEAQVGDIIKINKGPNSGKYAKVTKVNDGGEIEIEEISKAEAEKELENLPTAWNYGKMKEYENKNRS